MKTLAMQVRNTGFLLEKLAQDCGPTQFVRELTQNSVEAIQRVQRANPDYEGRIEWDYDEQASDREHGVLKVCITDNGDGMTADEMKTHINMLSSGRAQSLGGNFGMGAKIAALAYNPHGVMYLSWREGQGALVHLWRDPDTNEFGLRQMKRADDTFGHHMELAPDAKPGLIDNHGTRVVLLGTAEDSDTTAAPEGVDAKTDWIVKTLNTRYFRFPENLEVVARTNFQGVISDQNKQRRRVNGQRYVLDKVAISRDTVEITGARVHWWLLPSDKEKWGGANKASWSRDYAILGHVAALWRDELYEMAVSRSLMQEFGVTFGSSRVVIYVEPDDAAVTTDTARTRIRVHGEDPPWSDWAGEFRAKLPLPIAALVEELSSKPNEDVLQGIRERVRSMIELYDLPKRFVPTADGPMNADTTDLVPGGAAEGRGGTRGNGTRPPGTRGGRAGGAYADRQRADGGPAKKISAENLPRPMLVTADEALRRRHSDLFSVREPSELVERAASYDRASNTIKINADWRVIRHMYDRLSIIFQGRPGASAVIWKQMSTWVGQQLVETVISIEAMRGLAEWTDDVCKQALSPETLTAAACPRYLTFFRIKQGAASALGAADAAE